MSSFAEWDPILQAFLATVFTWLLTTIGAALVFGVRSLDRRIVEAMLGFAAGVMLAASVWSRDLARAQRAAGGVNIPVFDESPHPACCASRPPHKGEVKGMSG